MWTFIPQINYWVNCIYLTWNIGVVISKVWKNFSSLRRSCLHFEIRINFEIRNKSTLEIAISGSLNCLTLQVGSKVLNFKTGNSIPVGWEHAGNSFVLAHFRDKIIFVNKRRESAYLIHFSQTKRSLPSEVPVLELSIPYPRWFTLLLTLKRSGYEKG